MTPFATLSPASPRAAEWLAVFGTLTVPVESPRPFYALLPNLAGPQLVYMLDLPRLAPDQFQRVCLALANNFGYSALSPAAVRAEGVPVLAADITITIED